MKVYSVISTPIHFANNIGYSTYLGFLYLDYAYNNAVVHVFIKLLVDSQAGKDSTSIGKLQDVPAIDLYECRGKESTPKDVDIGGNTLGNWLAV